MEFHIDTDPSIGYEKNGLSKKLFNKLYIPLLNSLPVRTQGLVKKAISWQVIETATTQYKNKELELHDKELTARVINKDETGFLEKVFSLRHEVFAKQLQWINLTEDELDRDHYDDYAIIIAVYSEDHRILGTVRIIQNNKTFMMECDFKHCILGGEFKKDDHSIEISRLAVSPEIKCREIRKRVISLLYGLIYRWCVLRGAHSMYFVTTTKYIESLKKNYFLKIDLLGREHFTDTGVGYFAAKVDLKNSFRFFQIISKLPIFRSLIPPAFKWI